MRCARCDWQHDPNAETSEAEQAAEHAQASGHWLCDCGRSLGPDEPRTCERCLTDAREHLAGIVLMYDELPSHLGHVRSAALDSNSGGNDGRPLPGGDALVLLGPGSVGNVSRYGDDYDPPVTEPERWWLLGRVGPLTRVDWITAERVRYGKEHLIDNREDDAPSVAWALASWENDFRETRGDEQDHAPRSTSAAVHAAAGYLEVHARWAANNHDGFAQFAADLRSLHARMQAAANARRKPTRANADCFDCGSRLFWRVNEDGFEEDHATCEGCKREYDVQAYLMALKDAAEHASRTEQAGESYATPELLATTIGRSRLTIRSWAREGLVRKLSAGGVLMVNVADVQARHAERGKRRRCA